jgi:predicted amidophosphoribosyltransferase
MQCPNCGSDVLIPGPSYSYDTEGYTEILARNDRWGGITCDSCPAIMSISYKDSMQGFGIAFLIALLATIIGIILIVVDPGSSYDYYYYSFGIGVPLALIEGSIAFVAVLIIAGVSYGKRKLEIIGMRPACPSCGTALENKEVEFCSKCGASVTATVAPIPAETQKLDVPPAERVGVCMVCNLDLTTSDLAAWCPHCGNPAHRSHLLEWVHVKNRCPKCGEHLAEHEVTTKPVKKAREPKANKKTWRTI